MRNIRFSRKQLCIPYALFLFCFVILPLAVIVYYAFTDGSGRFTLANLVSFFTNGNTIGTLCYSLVIAAVVTAVCLLVAYPAAYVLARSGLRRGPVILMLFILPMWINFTLRITALKEILTVLEGNLSLHPFQYHDDHVCGPLFQNRYAGSRENGDRGGKCHCKSFKRRRSGRHEIL